MLSLKSDKNAPLQTAGFILVFNLVVLMFTKENILSAHDPANYYLAIKYGWSVLEERPHAPGSPLLVLSATIINSIINSPHLSLIALNLVFASLAIFFTIKCCLKIIKIPPLWLLILFGSNPVFLYFSSIAEVYIFDAFFCSFLLFAFFFTQTKHMFFVFMVIGVLSGFRISSFILTIPASIYLIYSKKPHYQSKISRSDIKYYLKMSLAFALGFFSWFIPYYIVKVGLDNLVKIVDATKDLQSTIYQNIAAFLVYLFWMLNIGMIILAANFSNVLKTLNKSSNTKIFFLLLIGSPLLFFIFSHYAKGYILLIYPCIFLLLGKMFEKLPRPLLIGSLLTNIVLFLTPFFIAPSLETTLRKEQRTPIERLQTAFLRGLSFFSPTLKHIRLSDQGVFEAESLIKSCCPKGSNIIVDISAAGWAYPRTLQSIITSDTFFLPSRKNNDYALDAFFKEHVLRNLDFADVLDSKTIIYMLIENSFLDRFGGIKIQQLVRARGKQLSIVVFEKPYFSELVVLVTRTFHMRDNVN